MKFLKEKPALVIDELTKKTLVIADLHLGLEYEIYKKGISIPPRAGRQKKRILKLIEDTEVDRLVLLGDVKHNVPRTSVSEKENLPGFFEELSRHVDIKISKGNHDGNIEDLVGNADVEISPTSGFREGKFYFNHGQSWPDEDIKNSETLIRGHSHPSIQFKDSLGFSSTVPCWVKGPVNRDAVKKKFGKGKLENIIITPTFNELITGMPMNKDREKRLLGPMLKNGMMEIEDSGIYLLDGTFLGKLEDL